MKYIDLHGKAQPTSWAQVFAAVERIVMYFTAVGNHFYERLPVVHKVQLAMMMREHVMVVGPTGAAKTALFRTIFGNIQGAKLWSRDLTKFDGDTHLFGSYDPRELETTGHMVHLVEGSLAEANFAHIGEFFDASDPTLRTLLGVLNERRLVRGPQRLPIPLLTAVADSNFRPEDMPARAAQLAAVVDRFLFKTEVAYVQDGRNDFEMHEAFLSGELHADVPPLSIDDVILVSGVVVGHKPNLLANKYVLEAYVELKRSVSAQRQTEGRPPISDRRSLRAAQLIEVSALLNGREEATFDDLWEVEAVLQSCLEDAPILKRSTEEAVKRWAAKEARHSIESELAELAVLTAKIPKNVDFSVMKSSEVFALQDAVRESIRELEAFKADSLEASTEARQGTEVCYKLLVDADKKLLRIAESNLPTDPGAVPRDALITAQKELEVVAKLLAKINLGDNDVITLHSRLTQRVALAQEILMRKLADRELDDLLRQWSGR